MNPVTLDDVYNKLLEGFNKVLAETNTILKQNDTLIELAGPTKGNVDTVYDKLTKLEADVKKINGQLDDIKRAVAHAQGLH